MGICYSSTGKRSREREWKSKYDEPAAGGGVIDLRKTTSGSNDFAHFISKISGGGGGAAAEERALHQIPGRLFGNGATALASLYTQQGKKGTNQDAMIVWEDFCSRNDTIFCGVFDGHGPYGHMVARKVRDCLPLLLRKEWESSSNSDQNCGAENGTPNGSTHFDEMLDDNCCEPTENEATVKFPDIHQPLKKSFLKAFKLMDKELKLHPTIDCFCSGTTAVTLVVQGQDIVLGNVGDSRAVLATRDKDNFLKAVQLTVDLKPNLPGEAARIQKYKGRVFALQDEPEVARVWLPNSDSPGLAMARAFGDFCLKDFGLISVPDVYYHRITEKDAFVVLATDGVWDVLSNKEAVDVVASAPSRATAARALVDCATRAWRLKYPTSKNDDCAVVCLFLEQLAFSNRAEVQNDLPIAPQEVVIVAANGDTMFANAPDISESLMNASRTSDSRFSSATSDISGAITTSDSKVSSVTDDDMSASSPANAANEAASSNVSEIEPVVEPVVEEKQVPDKSIGQSKRSLAECLSTAEDEEWSALEGITRVNSLLSLPRFLSMDKRSASWRKWL
ncbi:OLC1v1022329C1 [Oldenlandia corymbosa var. corymbosa]|uniref:protein-serine/threonine phosphatase n=1 Tax=Oldenlandia corymbosa var. corymbosa TaxID=529605 RepID=A0AAV1BZZ7_OLDCO|nr:OLC1v1022329C1 [Oldenlandia corymbosa var. corymbosa]